MINTSIIDFTNCPIDTATQYGGSEQKRAIFYGNTRYMLKFPDQIANNQRNPQLNATYTNSFLSEKVCCDILHELGFSVQNVLLGYVDFGTVRKPVVACKNFIPANAALISFKTIVNAILSTKLGKLPKLSEINRVLSEPSPFFTKEGGLTALRAYWDLFILDAFLGNFDRHADNWSYFSLAGLPGIQAIAPIYDCGSCLYPNITDEAIPAILASESEVNMRVDKFPTAALLLDNGHKVNYKDFIASGVNNECTAALLRIFPQLNMGTVLQVIDSEPLSDIRKKFYKAMLTTRYNRILAPAFHKFR